MVRCIRDYFTVSPEPPTPRDIVVWWEVRRPIYTVVLVASGIFTLLAMVAFCPDCFSEPFGLMLGIPLYFLAAHVFYTAGWLVELAVRTLRKRADHPRGRLPRRLLFVGLVFTVLLTGGPGIAMVTTRLVRGGASAPWAYFTRLEPEPVELVGIYSPTVESRSRLIALGYPGDAAFTIELAPNGRARLSGFPVGHFEYDEAPPPLLTTAGRWRLTTPLPFSGEWRLGVDLPDSVLPPDPRQAGSSYRRTPLWFVLRREAPPYELFQWIDRSAMSYLLLQQQEKQQ